MIVLIDLLNSAICTTAGIYAVIFVLHVFSSKYHTPFLPVVIVGMGVMGWATFFTLSLMTVSNWQTAIPVTWHVNQGYTFGRLALTAVWLHYLIKLDEVTK